MTQLNGVQHQPSLHIGVSHHIPVTYSSNAIGIPFFHSSGSWRSLIQGKIVCFCFSTSFQEIMFLFLMFCLFHAIMSYFL